MYVIIHIHSLTLLLLTHVAILFFCRITIAVQPNASIKRLDEISVAATRRLNVWPKLAATLTHTDICWGITVLPPGFWKIPCSWRF